MDIALFCICSNSCIKYLGKLKWKDSTVQHNTLYIFFFKLTSVIYFKISWIITAKEYSLHD